eukprot:1187291-Prorocentrum_minimum.AAC.2
MVANLDQKVGVDIIANALKVRRPPLDPSRPPLDPLCTLMVAKFYQKVGVDVIANALKVHRPTDRPDLPMSPTDQLTELTN